MTRLIENTTGPQRGDVSTEANARLIAMAPDMHAWIKSLHVYLVELANGNLPKRQFNYAQAAREAETLLRKIEEG